MSANATLLGIGKMMTITAATRWHFAYAIIRWIFWLDSKNWNNHRSVSRTHKRWRFRHRNPIDCQVGILGTPGEQWDGMISCLWWYVTLLVAHFVKINWSQKHVTALWVVISHERGTENILLRLKVISMFRFINPCTELACQTVTSQEIGYLFDWSNVCYAQEARKFVVHLMLEKNNINFYFTAYYRA